MSDTRPRDVPLSPLESVSRACRPFAKIEGFGIRAGKFQRGWDKWPVYIIHVLGEAE
jgi:hypothetical protein